MIKQLRQAYKKFKFLPFRQLDFGKFENSVYSNELLGCRLRIAEKYQAQLNSLAEREEEYKLLTTKLIINSKEEINDSHLRWTKLVSFSISDKLYFNSQIRAIELFEKTEPRKIHENWVKKLKTPNPHIPKGLSFNYELFRKVIGSQEFDGIEFSEIWNGKSIHGMANTQLLGVRGRYLIQLNFSYIDEAYKSEVWGVVNNAEFN